MSTDTPRFDQARKEAAETVEDAVRAHLCEYYGVPAKRVVSAEHGREGAYETGGEYRATDLLDYAGVDWLVDARPEIVPVGERIRPNTEAAGTFRSASITAVTARASRIVSARASSAASPRGRCCSGGAPGRRSIGRGSSIPRRSPRR